MNKIAKFTGVILAMIIAFSCMILPVSAAGESFLTIRIFDGVAEVTGCLTTASGKIDIPSTYNGVSVTRISNNAFNECARISEVTIPSSVTSIGTGAFNNCDALKTVNFEGSSCTLGTSVFNNCVSLETVNLPSNLKSVPEKMFYGCYSLKEITIPSTVTSIGKEAFGICSSVSQFSIPASVTSIGKNAFIGCRGVTAYSVESGNTKYSSKDGVLYGETDKSLIQYPNASTRTSYAVVPGTKIIADYAFGDNTKLTKVTLPNGLEKIDSYAFYNCKTLSDITIPSTVTFLGSQSFGRCPVLRNITIPSSVTEFESAFYKSGIENVVIANGVRKIGIRSFEECTSLVSVEIPSSVETIDIGAFYNCTALNTLSVPASVRTINSGAFYGCKNITLYVDRDSVIHNYAVENGIKYVINGGDTVKSVSVLSLPNKTSYIYKEDLDTTGLKLSVVYADGSFETVTSGYEVSHRTLTKTGSQIIDVTYGGKTAQFSVDVSYAWWQWVIMILLLGIFWY